MAIPCPFNGCTWAIPEGTDPGLAPVLLTTHALNHQTNPRAKPAAVKRPELTSGGTTEAWTYFLQRWRSYVTSVQLTGQDLTIQLLECCDSNLRRDVTRNAVGPLPIEGMTEKELLAAIKSLAVTAENTKVARVALSRMTQDRTEPIRAFAARLRGQAEVCRFLKKCPNCDGIVNQGEERVADQLCIGLADAEIQEDLLKHPDQDLCVEDTIRFIEVRVAGKKSAMTISTPNNAHAIDDHSAEAVTSQYRRQQRPPPPRNPPTPPRGRGNTPSRQQQKPRPQAAQSSGPCAYCGQRGHGEQEKTAYRRIHCPAFGSTCTSCGRQHHTASVCWQRTEHESALSELAQGMSEGTLPHQTWQSDTSSWVQQRSPSQPVIAIRVSSHAEDFRTHGHTLPRESRHIPTTAIADTGCQSCLAGTDLMSKLHLDPNDLIPVNLTMKSASGNNLPILGAALLRIEIPSGKKTRQMVYFSSEASHIYLSMATLADLDLIPRDFPSGSSPTRDNRPSPNAAQISQTTPPAERPFKRAGGDAASAPSTTTMPPERGPGIYPPRTSDDTPLINQARRPCSCPTRSPPPPRPAGLPYPATPENRARLEQHLLQTYASSSFNTCEHQPLPMMAGPPLSLSIDPNAVPKPYHTPITVPIHWQDEVKAGLDRDVRLGVLEKVPLGTPDTWCHRMVICTKKNGSLRRTINFQELNKHATRETHHCASPFHQARAVPGNTKKTIFDAWNGYHSVALSPEDRHFTTFITPWGRYRYCSAPQGYIASGDAYTARYDAIVSHIGRKTQCIDDALLWSESIEEAYHQATEWLHTCALNGITLNPRKFRFAQDEVDFAGFTITPSEVRPSQKYLEAITGFPTPKNITDVRAWFGLVNQVAYAFSMAPTMQPFRDLLKPTNPFLWNAQTQRAFDLSKTTICQRIAEGVTIYDKSRPTCLATDWSKDGIGYWLFQKHCQCPSREILCCQEGWKVVLVGSRFTHSAESRYAPIEGEALAVADALEKARHFVLGCSDLQIAVDHKPLLKIFGDRSLEDIHNTRLRNLKEKTLPYRFQMVYIPGIRNHTSDALSRHPSGDRFPAKLYLQDDHHSDTSKVDPSGIPKCHVASLSTTPEDTDGLATALCAAVHHIPITWETLQIATAADPALRLLSEVIEDGPPEARHHMPATIREYFPILDSITNVDGVLVKGERIIIPLALRQRCLDALHAAHQGATSMNARAQTSLYWPGMSKEITATRQHCATCNGNAPSQPAMPSTTPADPEYPFQHLCADYFHHGGFAYLVLVDRYSNWPIVTRSTNGAEGLCRVLRDTFATYGIPETLTSDGGPEFASHTTRDFLSSWSVFHRTSSAYNPHANCRAETAVKTTKRLIAGNTGPGGTLSDDFHQALLQYRNGPSPGTGMSPAQCLFGRATRDILPGLPATYRPHQDWTSRLDLRERALSRRQATGRARWDEHTQGLSPLRCGDTVMIQNQTGRHPTKWDKSGTVVEVLQYHQYAVRTDGSGRLTTRNRRYLRRFDPFTTSPNPFTVTRQPTRPTTPPPATTQDRQPAPTQPPTSTATNPPPVTTQDRQPAPTQPPTSTATSPPQPQTPLPHPASPPQPQQPVPLPPQASAPPKIQPRPTYASVTKTPARPAPLPPRQLALLPTPPRKATPVPRRSKRAPKPIDRFG